MRMSTIGRLAAAILVVALSTPYPAQAALRCGHKLVLVGDHKIDVLAKCGEPTLVTEQLVYGRTVPRRTIHGRVSGIIAGPADREEWTYNFGPRRLVHIIRFRLNEVDEILSLEHGY